MIYKAFFSQRYTYNPPYYRIFSRSRVVVDVLKGLMAWHEDHRSLLKLLNLYHEDPPLANHSCRRHPAFCSFLGSEPSRIMAYDGFEYPPVPNTYTDVHSTFDSSNAHSSDSAPALEKHNGIKPSSYPYYLHHATAPSAASSPFYSNPGCEVRAFQEPTFVHSFEPPFIKEFSPSPAFTEQYSSPAESTDTQFVACSPKIPYKKRPRGTTGTVFCHKCGSRFTVASSLYRHKKGCRGKTRAEKVSPMEHNPLKSKNVGFMSDSTISTACTIADFLRSGDASSISDFTLPESCLPKQTSTQSYVPQGLDTSADHASFFCDLCPGTFARRDILQMHKARVHHLTEFPYMPDSGAIVTPRYLNGVTPENGTKHSRFALQVFEGGALSTSPCQPCQSKGCDCIVNPFVSSRCCYCNYRDSGLYCGAAGVKYS